MKRPFTLVISLFLLLFHFPLTTSALIPSDRFYNEQWYLKKVKAEEAWDHTTGSRDVVIAVIDTGVDVDHPDLVDNLWINEDEIAGDGIDNDGNGFIDDRFGWDFIAGSSDPRPKFSEFFTVSGMHHGTIVAGIIAAAGSNREGIAGLSFRSQIMPLRALDGRGSGDVANVLRAIEYAIANGADIINLSFVGREPSPSLSRAVRDAYDRGVLIVSASGNDTIGSGIDLDVTPHYPACSDSDSATNFVVGVAALTDDDKRAPFSNYGSRCIDITAPGSRFLGAQFYRSETEEGYNKRYGGWWSGTSLAAPVISGTFALMKSIAPNLTNRDLIDILLKTADSIASQNPELVPEKLGAGRVNVARAVSEAQRQNKNSNGTAEVDRRPFEFHKIVTGAGPGGGPHVRVFDTNGELRAQFFAYDARFRGGVRVAVGDVDGDGGADIVTSPGPGGGPHVRVFTEDGRFKSHFFADDPNFRGGVFVAMGDVNSDGRDEVVVTFGKGKESLVKIFNGRGELLHQFLAFPQGYREGMRVAVGDVDGNGQEEILVTQVSGEIPLIRVFRRDGSLLSQITAFDQPLPNGINMQSADINRDGKDEIIVSPSSGGGPQVRVFSGEGTLLSQFFAFPEKFRGGVAVSMVDAGSQKLGYAVALESGSLPLVRIFSADEFLQTQFFAYHEAFRGGVSVAGGP